MFAACKHDAFKGEKQKRRGKNMKKLLAMALALLMVAVLLPVTAMAEGTALPEPDGNGVITPVSYTHLTLPTKA